MTTSRSPLPLALAGLFALTGCSVLSSTPNPAQQQVTQIVNGLKSAHPRQICDNGDDGHGLDNNRPWYEGYIEVDLNPDPLAAIKSSAQGPGFQLQDNTQFINDLKGIARPDGSHDTPYGGERFNSTSSYLIATKDDTELRVTVTRSGSVALYCSDVKTYGKPMSTPTDKAIVKLQISMPPT